MELTPVIPFEPIMSKTAPQGDHWTAQIKWDGVRMLSYCDGKAVRLVNRRLNDRSLQYPEFLSPAAYCRASSFILDGEFIAFDDRKPSFREIMKRDSLRTARSIEQAVRATPVTYMIFDVLFCDGEWVTGRPLRERQQLLADIVVPSPQAQIVQNVEDAEGLLALMRTHGMEGIVHKNLDSTYAIGGKDGRWIKRKLFYDLYAVIGGFTYREGAINAVLLGVYTDDLQMLTYIGHAGPGKLKSPEWRELAGKLAMSVQKTSPFHNKPERYKDAIWTAPTIVARVQFMEWTSGGTMRHPTVQSVCEGIEADRCRLELT